MHRIMYCSTCGKELADTAYMCPSCGAPTCNHKAVPANASDKDWLAALLLCLFLGPLGVHSFYAGKPLIGILQLITAGGCGIWSLIDLIMIIIGNYRDGEGKLIVNNR